MNPCKQLMTHVQSFFQTYLAAHRALSPNTILSYRDALKLFLRFTALDSNKPVAKLQVEDLQPEKVLAFLDHIEVARKNSAVTRNLRLAALRTFFNYLIAEDTLRAGQYQRILAIPFKRAPHPMMGYLEVNEVQAILQGIDRSSPAGRRDHALFNFLHNTGARVQEAIDLRVGALRFAAPPVVTLTGKGSKTRQVPLWENTAQDLQDYLRERKVNHTPEAVVFANRQGGRLTRSGIRYILRCRTSAAASTCPTLKQKRVSPHTWRHSTAMHLLQSGVDLTVVQNWLGHVHLATTHAYVEADMQMKRKALSALSPTDSDRRLGHVLEKNQDVIRWLESLK
jgi:integrase/recombinase XerD